MRWLTSVSRDPDAAHVRREELVVRDVEEPDIGIRSIDVEKPTLKSRGIGDLCAKAHREVEDQLELTEYVGEHIATVWVDADAWEYRIEWQVEVPLLQRLRRAVVGVLG